jgi:hypothetical protein
LHADAAKARRRRRIVLSREVALDTDAYSARFLPKNALV